MSKKKLQRNISSLLYEQNRIVIQQNTQLVHEDKHVDFQSTKQLAQGYIKML